MAIRTCEGENMGICISSHRIAVKGTLFKEHHSREACQKQASLLLENMADLDRALTGPVVAVD